MLYYHSIVSPQNFVLAKLLFNSLLMLVMSLLSMVLFSLFLTYPVQKTTTFIAVVFLGGWSLSLVFTFLAAIAAKAQQNAAIMAILGFPIIIPQLLVLLKISSTVFSATASIPVANILLVIGSDVLVILLALILFPFLWKD
jgi:heme exporter protein B